MITGPPPLGKNVEKRTEELIRAYRLAKEQIENQLNQAALTSFQKFRLGEQLKQVNAIMTALDALAVETARRIQRASYKVGADMAAQALQDYGIDVEPVNFGNRIHTEALNAVTDQMAQDLLTANRSMRAQAKQILRKTQQKVLDERQINDIVSEGIIQGETRREVSGRLTEALRKELGEGAKVEIVGRDGVKRQYDPAYYAEIVARTRTREAVTEGSIRFGQQYGITLFQISVHDNPCLEICQRLQGKVFSTVPGGEFPFLKRRPPMHPKCRHTAIPFVARNKEELARLRAFSNSTNVVANLPDYQLIASGDSQGATFEDAALVQKKKTSKWVRARALDILNGKAMPTPEDKRLLKSVVAKAKFSSPESLEHHRGKRIEDKQWAPNVTGVQLLSDIRKVARSENAQCFVHTYKGQPTAVIISERGNAVPQSRLGDSPERLFLVCFNLRTGKITSGYQASSLEAITIKEDAVWLP